MITSLPLTTIYFGCRLTVNWVDAGASDNGKKINVWSTNKFSNKLNTAVSVAFIVAYLLQCKVKWWKTVLIYSFTVNPTEKGGTKELNKSSFFSILLWTEEGTLNTVETAACNSFQNLLVFQTLIFLQLSLAPGFDPLYLTSFVVLFVHRN